MDRPRKRHHILPLLWLIWLVSSSILFLLFFPRLRDSVVKSGVLTLIRKAEEAGEKAGYRSVDVCFLNARGEGRLHAQSQRRLGGSIYHDTLESLLAGPDMDALKSGVITAIAPGTKLIGCTLSGSTLFVDLSEEFLSSVDIAKARLQIEETMTNFSRVDEVVILVEGKERERNERGTSPCPDPDDGRGGQGTPHSPSFR